MTTLINVGSNNVKFVVIARNYIITECTEDRLNLNFQSASCKHTASLSKYLLSAQKKYVNKLCF